MHYNGTEKLIPFSAFSVNILPASRRCQRSHLQCLSFTVQRTRWSTSPTAWLCSSAVPRPWSRSGWRERATTTLSFTVSTWRGYDALLTRTWLHSMPEKHTASLCLYEWDCVCVFVNTCVRGGVGGYRHVCIEIWVKGGGGSKGVVWFLVTSVCLEAAHLQVKHKLCSVSCFKG